MKILFDFFPILLFFIAYKFGDLYLATIVAIATSIIQVSFLKLKFGSVEKTHIITLASLVILGGATLIFKDERFIKWKPTVVYWAMSIAFLGSQYIGRKTFLEHIAAKSLNLPAYAWRKLNCSWSIFFAFVGGLNLYIAFHFDTNTWVNFKLFGTLALTFVFLLLQSIYMARHMKNNNTSE